MILLLKMISPKFLMVCSRICGENPAIVWHFIVIIWIFRLVLHSQHSQEHLSLSCIIAYQTLLGILTLKKNQSKISSTIAGKLDGFKGKDSVLWFEGLCGVSARRPRSGVSLSLASHGLQCTVQDGCYAI